jgi:hypothetical protein
MGIKQQLYTNSYFSLATFQFSRSQNLSQSSKKEQFTCLQLLFGHVIGNFQYLSKF